ncbi:CD99 antigen-like protein 2 isoform X4 [Hippocampus zosterae]|uniref:CD99 antigen-like protein 2 isoform X4 n=1 Tax=Hippocampus zosterae TaxID=109293 RepID=UPI00223D80F9|nr:CD99 antigen-like protein 2 isoform X4 [Hippocampus zosterae]
MAPALGGFPLLLAMTLMMMTLVIQVRPQGLDLADALAGANTPTPLPGTKAPVKSKGKGGGFSDRDLIDVSEDDSYKPDKGKGRRPSGDRDHVNQRDDNIGTTAEVGTIAGIVSAVGMALVGAISSYISYQKKKFCFSIQQSLNAEMVKADAPDAVLATEPQVQQTLLEQASAEPGRAHHAV